MSFLRIAKDQQCNCYIEILLTNKIRVRTLLLQYVQEVKDCENSATGGSNLFNSLHDNSSRCTSTITYRGHAILSGQQLMQ